MSNIIIPRRELLVACETTMGMQGFLRLQCRNKFSGKITQDTGWFPNTILDAGRNVMATQVGWMDYCQIGTDGVFPLTLAQRQAETALGNHFAGTSTIVSGSTSNGQAGAAPYYGWKRKTWRFAAGTFNGGINLSEAGIGWGTTGSTLISRAPILDPILQLPTTVTPLADELLDVTYELRYYPPLVDVDSPQVTLDGVAYNTLTRAASVTGDRWSASIGSVIGQYSAYITDWTAYDGNIGTILTGPNGVSAACDNANQYNSAYANNSYQMQVNCITGSTGWNLGSGIRSIRLRTTAGDYQTQFNAAIGGATIPKTSAYTMTMAWTISWAEYIAPWLLTNAPYKLGDRASHNGLNWQSDIDNNSSEPGVANWTIF